VETKPAVAFALSEPWTRPHRFYHRFTQTAAQPPFRTLRGGGLVNSSYRRSHFCLCREATATEKITIDPIREGNKDWLGWAIPQSLVVRQRTRGRHGSEGGRPQHDLLRQRLSRRHCDSPGETAHSKRVRTPYGALNNLPDWRARKWQAERFRRDPRLKSGAKVLASYMGGGCLSNQVRSHSSFHRRRNRSPSNSRGNQM
jgi:hypothetical protein